MFKTFFINPQNLTYLDLFPSSNCSSFYIPPINDGNWHQLCLMAEITNGRREIFLDGLKGTLNNDVKDVSPTIPPEIQVTPAIPPVVPVNPGFLQPVWYPGPGLTKSLVRRSIKGPENELSSQLASLGTKNNDIW